MPWISDLADKAEQILTPIDQNAAEKLQKKKYLKSTATDEATLIEVTTVPSPPQQRHKVSPPFSPAKQRLVLRTKPGLENASCENEKLMDFLNDDSKPSEETEIDNKSLLKCIHCDKIYKEKKRLTEHIRRTHKKNLAGESILDKFICDTCGKLFGRKDYLLQHIKKFHQSSVEFKCNHCTYKSKFISNLKRHIVTIHAIPKKFACSYCKTGFKTIQSLKRHEKKVHSIQRYILTKQINRKCPLCLFTSHSKTTNEINTHFSKIHGLALKPEEHRFDNMDDFYRWKDDLEKRTCTFYVKKIQNVNRGYYKCHRRGLFKRTGTIRPLKLDGSCKINGHCPSDIKVKIRDSGTVSVLYVPTHVGHTNKLKLSKLTKKEKQIIAGTRKRHKVSLTIPLENVVLDTDKWNVRYGTELHSVKKVQDCKTCRLQCLHCNSCVHEFLCTCKDNSIKNNMCKHIHAVARTVSQQANTTQPDEQTSLIIEEQPILEEVIISEINNDSNIIKSSKFEEYYNLLPNKVNTEQKKEFAAKRIKELIAALDAMDATEDQSANVCTVTHAFTITGSFADAWIVP